MSEVGSRGLAAVFREALAIASAGTAGFGVSIDLDALDPGAAPGVGTPVPGGLSPEALAAVLEPLAGLPAFRALEVVEYSPRLDLEGSTARAALDLAFAALCGAKQEAQVFPHAVERDGS
jgi:arginase family enzyme